MKAFGIYCREYHDNPLHAVSLWEYAFDRLMDLSLCTFVIWCLI